MIISQFFRLMRFPLVVIPCFLATGFIALALYQRNRIFELKAELASAQSERVLRQETTTLMTLRLAVLEAKDIAYTSAHVTIAWDRRLHRGLIALQNLPAAPAGNDYQLWVLDPRALAPISAGLLNVDTSSEGFAVAPVGTLDPGFAISMEPRGGRPSPTGPILFAVAPGP